MKYCIFTIGILSCCLAGADDAVNLCSHGDMEEVNEAGVPQGWKPIGILEMESDSVDYKSGERSLKVRTPDGKSVALSSESIPVQPNREYEIEASILAQGDRPASRPFVGIRLIGNNHAKYPNDESDPYLMIWSPSDDEVGFVTKKKRFITDSNARWVSVYLVFRERPSGYINVDDVILKEAD